MRREGRRELKKGESGEGEERDVRPGKAWCTLMFSCTVSLKLHSSKLATFFGHPSPVASTGMSS